MTSYVKNKTRYEKENFFQNVSKIILNNSYHDKFHSKIKLKCLEKELSQQITETRQNDDYKLHHTSKTGHDMKKNFFSKCSTDDA